MGGDNGCIVVDSGTIRYAIVHYHFFKNGGSTIEGILDREFGGGFVTLHGPLGNSPLDSQDLADFLASRKEISAISSHHLRYPKPAIRRMVIFDWCFLRDPLDRLQSLYQYFRQLDSTDALAGQARRLSAAEF